MRARAFIILWNNWDEVFKWGIELVAGKENIVLDGHYYDNGENGVPANRNDLSVFGRTPPLECQEEVKRLNRIIRAETRRKNKAKKH